MSNSRYYQRKKKEVVNIQEATRYYYNKDKYSSLGFTNVCLHHSQIKLIMTALEHYNFLLNSFLYKSEETKFSSDCIFLTYHSLLNTYADKNYVADSKITRNSAIAISNDFKYYIA